MKKPNVAANDSAAERPAECASNIRCVQMAIAYKRGVLAGHRLFSGCPAAALDELALRSDAMAVAAGTRLFEMGDPGTRLHVVIAGEVRITVPSADGKEVALALIGPGDVFGEIAVLDGGPRTAGAVVVRPARLLAVERRDLLAVMARHPAVAERLLEVVCAHLRRATTQIEELSFVGASLRLARTLIRLAKVQGTALIDGCTVSVTQRELGEAIGLSRESTNRLLKDFERRALVALDKGRIAILHVAGLRQAAELQMQGGVEPAASAWARPSNSRAP